jgi:hypothetical protein
VWTCAEVIDWMDVWVDRWGESWVRLYLIKHLFLRHLGYVVAQCCVLLDEMHRDAKKQCLSFNNHPDSFSYY